MEHLRIICDTLDTLELPEGDYLKMMNALKKLNDVIPKEEEREEREEDEPIISPVSIARLSDLEMNEIINMLFVPREDFLWNYHSVLDILKCYKSILDNKNVNIGYNSLHLMRRYIKYCRDDTKEVLCSSTSYKKYILTDVISWKNSLIKTPSLNIIKPKDIPVESEDNHILKINFRYNKMIEEFHLTTRRIRLGSDTHIVKDILRTFLLNKLLNSGLDYKDIHLLDSIVNYTEQQIEVSNIYKLRLITSGLTPKTADKHRYYNTESGFYNYSINATYISKFRLAKK